MLKNYLLKMIATTDNRLISEYCLLKAPNKFTFILRRLRNEFTIEINPSLISFFSPLASQSKTLSTSQPNSKFIVEGKEKNKNRTVGVCLKLLLLIRTSPLKMSY